MSYQPHYWCKLHGLLVYLNLTEENRTRSKVIITFSLASTTQQLLSHESRLDTKIDSVQGLWFNDYCSRIMVQGLWLKDCGSTIIVQGLWFKDNGSRIMVQ